MSYFSRQTYYDLAMFPMQASDPTSRVSFNSIQQPNVVEQIIETFKQSLIHGKLRPGDRLPSETELAQQLGVGRGAVREAMKVLQALGVVNIRQGDGTYIVDQPSPTLLSPLVFAVMLEAGANDELFELRYLIQVGYVELAAQKATPEDLQKIESAKAALENSLTAGAQDVNTLTQLDLEFHFAVLEATHNPLVIKIGRTVEALFFTTIGSALVANVNLAIEGHRRIVEALRLNDPAAIRRAVGDSLVRWKDEVRRSSR